MCDGFSTCFRLFFVLVIVIYQLGCATASSVKKGTGEKAKLSFVLVDNSTPEPVIYWRESPRHAETLLTLSIDVPDCERVRLFVNPQGRRLNELSREPVTVRPMTLASEEDLGSMLNRLPADRCAALLFAGEITQPVFRGIAVDHRGMDCQDYEQDICKDIEAEYGSFVFVPVAALVDIVEWQIGVYPVLAAGYGVKKAADALEEPFTDTVQVTLSLGGGQEHVFVADYAKARTVLDNAPFELSGAVYTSINVVPNEWEMFSFWVRAALVDAGVDFRLQQVRPTPTTLENEAITEAPRLHITSLNGQDGLWYVAPAENGEVSGSWFSTRTRNLSEEIDATREILVSMQP